MLKPIVKATWLGLLVVGYPIVIYILLAHQVAWLGALLVFGVLAWKLRYQERWLLTVIIFLISASILGRLYGLEVILKLSPLLVYSSLFYIFFRSLKGTSLIERFARLDFQDEFPPGIADYCRKLTIVWTLFFAANIAWCVWLAIRGDDATWVLYNSLIVYLLIGALMLGEYFWRRIAFPGLEIPPLSKTVRNIINKGHQIWEQERRDDA